MEDLLFWIRSPTKTESGAAYSALTTPFPSPLKPTTTIAAVTNANGGSARRTYNHIVHFTQQQNNKQDEYDGFVEREDQCVYQGKGDDDSFDSFFNDEEEEEIPSPTPLSRFAKGKFKAIDINQRNEYDFTAAAIEQSQVVTTTSSEDDMFEHDIGESAKIQHRYLELPSSKLKLMNARELYFAAREEEAERRKIEEIIIQEDLERLHEFSFLELVEWVWDYYSLE
ncbi:1265_t:CDS:2 [Ambispora gerdemannii]|uniref:1265_t:CDS:1 n=1 Tax=Ambispora gerdemannii TaxID=144530 RepID=A0A9N9BGJ1_9GLOM|nr:1265_t:CDS:2 [Ambispora gerdemannii]